MKILITGGGGFVGGHVAADLAARGHTVCAPDRGEMDITDAAAVARVFREERPEGVLHLAALVHKRQADLSEEHYRAVNVDASEIIFACAAEYGARTVLYASSIEVYGPQESRVIHEGMPCHAETLYGKSKLEAEERLLGHAGSFSRYAILRFAPVYAPDFRLNVDKRFYLPRKIAAYYFREGEYAFNFCALRNILDFLAAFLEGGGASGIYNISDSRSVTAREFIALEKEHAGLRRVIRLPYGFCHGLIAAVERVSRLFSSSDPFLSTYNFHKLFQSTVYDNSRANTVTPLRWDVESLYEK